MTSHSEILDSLIKNKRNVCCLCFCKIEPQNLEFISTKDQIIVNINGDEETVLMSEILLSVLGNETYNFVASFDILCDECIKTAVNSYSFVITCRRNTELMMKMLDTIVSSVEAASEHLFGSKTLYLSLNPQDFTSNQFYDCRKISNCTEASRRFTDIIKPPELLVGNLKPKREKRSRNIDLPLSKIIYDESNIELLKCKECFKVYRSLCNLRNHYIRVHAPKKYKCGKCPRRFGSRAFLNVHERDSHSVFVCPECGKIFYNSNSFKEHEIGHEMLIVCPDCGRTYKNKSTFKKHKENNVCEQQCRAEPSKGKFTCDYCGKKYTQKMSLRVHIQYEHGNYKAHICEWCGKKYWAQSRLKAHIVKHTKEKKFACSICGGKFVTKESLVYHTRIHTGEKPYMCSHCDASFISASRRSEHYKRHHLGIFLECDICNAKFTSKTSMMKHKRSHEKHNNQVDSKLSIDCPNEVVVPSLSYEVYEDNGEGMPENTYYLKVCDDSEYIINIPKNET